MRKATKEKLTAFNMWLAESPKNQLDSDDIDSVIEYDEMSSEELKAIRNYFDFEQTEMAKLLNSNLSTYQKWERSPEVKGSVKIPLVTAELLRIFYSYPDLTIARLRRAKNIKT